MKQKKTHEVILRHSLQSKEKMLHLEVWPVHLSVCDLVSAPISLDRFSSNSEWELPLKVVKQLSLSAILIYNEAWFTYGHKCLFSCILYTLPQILLMVYMGDFN
jgi:hypothetical protein